MPVIHNFISTIGDEPVSGRVRPTEWNEAHVVNVDLAHEVFGQLPVANIDFTGSNFTVANFASPNVSQWTNDAGYLTSSSLVGYVPYTGATNNVVLGAHSITASNLSGTNTGDVTLAGQNYLSILGQVITANAVNLAGSNVTGILPNTNTTAASTNTASAIVTRDGSGNFAAGTIAADLAGTASTATVANTISTSNEATDTTCFIGFFTAAGTQTLQLKNNASLGYDSSSNTLTITAINPPTSTILAINGGSPVSNVNAPALNITSANGVGNTSSNGGDINIISGNGIGASGAGGGAINITGGNSVHGNDTGSVTIKAGTSTTTGGITNIQGGAGVGSSSGGGALNLIAGAAPGLGIGGDVNVTGGSASTSGTGGHAVISGGASGTTSTAGNVYLRGGVATSGTQGAVIFDVGNVKMSLLTASQAVVTDASKNLTSLAYASTNTLSALVQRDGSGNFAAGTIAAALTGNASTATALQNARTIGGVSFNGTANITVATATGGFTVSGGDLAIGANNITCTGSLGATGARLTKGWFTDLQVTNAIAGSITGNAATATALQNARTIGGVSFDGTANIVPQTIQSINEATDTTCFPLFISASGTQSLQPLNNAGLTYNSNTNAFAAGAFTGTAFTATSTGTVYIQAASTTTGSANEGGLNLVRGDQANGYAQTHYKTTAASVVTDLWATGLRAADAKYHVFDVVNSVDQLIITGGTGTTGVATFAGGINVGGLTASELTGTDASKNIISGNLTGDVTTSAFAATIAANAVTYAKFQQVAASSLIGNATGSLADATGITLGTSLTFSGSTINTIQAITTSSSPTFSTLTTTSTIRAQTATNSAPDIYTYDASGSAYLGMGFGSVYTQGGIYVKSKAGNAYTFVLMDLWNGGGGITDFNNVYFYAQNTNTIKYTTSTVTVPLSTASTSTTTGALVVTGGVGVGGAVYISGAINNANLSASSLVATDGSKNLTSTTTSLTPQFSTLGLGAAASAATITSQLNIFSATQNSSRIILSGQEFYQASNTSADGIGFLLGVNRSANRQLWIVDTALAGSSASHPVLRLGPGGDANGATVDCLATDGTTILPLRVGNSGALLNLVGSSVTSSAVLYPTSDNSFTLGKSGNRWSQLWAGTTTINTSDANTKNNINKTRLGLEFINKLIPREFKFNDDEVIALDTEGNETKRIITHKRVHHGFVAQEIKNVLDDLVIDANDFAGYIDPRIEDPNDIGPCGLRYSEFIAPLVCAIQELSRQVELLKN